MSGIAASRQRAALPSVQALEEVVGEALERARALGAEAAEAGLSVDQGLSVTVRMGEVETVEHHRDRGLGITVYLGRRKGSASTNDLSREAVQAAVEAAVRIARHAAEDPHAGLPDPEDLAREIPDLDLHHPWGIDAEEAVRLASACEAAARGHDRRITNSEGATVTSHEGVRVYGNSHGFLAGYPATRHSVSCAVVASAGEAMERDYWYTVAREPEAMEAAEVVGRRAAERALRRLGARKLATRRVPVVFVAELARGLVGHLVGAVRGPSLYRRASFLLDAAGERIFPEFVRMTEHPHIPRALGSAPFDDEGVATREQDLVRDGVLVRYVLDSYSARRLGLRTTGNAGGVHNLTVEPGEHDLAGMLREMGTGLLVTELLGHGVNLVTGDYSRGAAGFWVEGGEIAHPVHEITVAGNLREMFANLRAVGRDLDLRGSVRTGSWLVDGMTVAGD
ncbi:microcin-processing peptidase 1 [Inmirania thermothiophila]|uniref:Microcin-processing peptidase 1 n=1 Tax=Inmirania thermothiophila TaxID=1750597 RepID=A0A3N1Y7X4_9GAMM|nr:metalloprotease PmbA [Inmirania thermothiophila]ROR34875.1 microcin-processing peptidase 1 [Inmirania thermothiophila]